jgi:hypothetical protein
MKRILKVRAGNQEAMKKYVITLSKVFPTTHPKAGIPTGFEHKLHAAINGWSDHAHLKLHTIRANYPLWAKRFEQIERGEAYLSVRQWSGKPYASKQVEIARLTKEDGIGLQELTFYKECRLSPAKYTLENFEIDGKWQEGNTRMLAENDGLTLADWEAWFSNPKYDLSEPMAIIHFTKFRY